MAEFLKLNVGIVRATERQHQAPIKAIAVAGSRILLGGLDGRLLGFQPLPSGPLTIAGSELRAPPFEDIRCARCGDTDKFTIVSANGDEFVRVWTMDPAADNPEVTATVLRGHKGSVFGVDLHQKGFALSAAEDCAVRLWDLEAEKEAAALVHRRACLQVRFVPNDTGSVVTVDAESTLRIWDVRVSGTKPQCVMSDAEDGPGNSLAISSCSGGKPMLLATASRHKRVRFYDPVRSGARPISQLRLPKGGGPVFGGDVSSENNKKRPTAPALEFVLQDRYLLAAGGAPRIRDGRICAIRLEDFAVQMFYDLQGVLPDPELADHPAILAQIGGAEEPARNPIRVMRAVPWRSKQLVMWAFEAGGWGFGVLEEVSMVEEPFLESEVPPGEENTAAVEAPSNYQRLDDFAYDTSRHMPNSEGAC